MESPDFFLSGDDGKWLDDALKGFGEEEQSDPKDFDLDNLSPEDIERARITGFFLRYRYQNSNYLNMIDADRAAIDMMGSLARFLERGQIATSSGSIRIGDRYPDITVRHVNLYAKLGLRDVEGELLTSVQGTEAHSMRLMRRSLFSKIESISSRAMEFEEKRKGK